MGCTAASHLAGVWVQSRKAGKQHPDLRHGLDWLFTPWLRLLLYCMRILILMSVIGCSACLIMGAMLQQRGSAGQNKRTCTFCAAGG